SGMSRLLALVVAVSAACAFTAGPSLAGPPARGGTQHGTYPAPGVPGARSYDLYVPHSVAASPRRAVPLVVYLHGCTQTAQDAATGTRLDALAERKGFLVLYPEQLRPATSTAPVSDGNGAGCWNWFLPQDQVRDAGEPATLAGMTRSVMARFRVDAGRVWLAGVSAGADMTTILGAAYPDLFAAIAPIAGCAYRTCSDLDGSAAYAAMGPRARELPVFIVQGSADMLNNVGMGATAVAQWLGTNDLADDGSANMSVSRQPASVTTRDLDASLVTGKPGDPCIANFRFPCLGGALGLRTYPTTTLSYADAKGREVVRVLVIHGANHAYTGGDSRGTFVDPLGPDLTSLVYDFFQAHPRR
ncbi:MAG: PHB depolymerase family esterase, partial [Actinomycetota bacterium]|nr:PHB depolymerase family esterase [Actinomycetota bacterium]